MVRSTEGSHRLCVDAAGRLEIPAEQVGGSGFAAGTAVTLRRRGDALEIVPDPAADRRGQFIAWRDISHSLLTGGR